jgi:gliding motility-associated-like protein
MKTIKNCLFIFVLLFNYTPLYSQNVLINQGGTVSVNGGEIFYDAGGPAGNDGNANQTITLCPNNPNEKVAVIFTSFTTYFYSDAFTDEKDMLNIFNGNSISDLNIGSLTGDYTQRFNNGTNPFRVGSRAPSFSGNPTYPASVIQDVYSPTIFSSTNANGCLTFQFVNSSTVQSSGWVANVITFESSNTPGCNITIEASENPICEGQTTTLSINGTVISTPINNDFNDETIGDGWEASSSATFPSSICGSGSLDASTFLWMQNAAGPRSLETTTFDVSNGGTISFEYRQPTNNGTASPCESPDFNTTYSSLEGVYLQYSTDNGTSWTNLKYIFPSATNISSLYGCGYYVHNWTRMEYPIPQAAQTANTKFRWFQAVVTSASTDNWGLDNVVISTPLPATITLTDETNGGTVLTTSNLSTFTFDVSPTATTTYRATISDGVTSCFEEITINVTNGEIANAGSNITQCENNQFIMAANNPIAPTVGEWSVVSGTVSPTTSSNPNQVFTLTGTTATLRWTLNGICNTFDDVIITNTSSTVVPTFNALTSVCQNAVAPILPLVSNNGITGTWSPLVNTATSGTKTFTFTPDAGQCATTTTITLVVNPLLTPSVSCGTLTTSSLQFNWVALAGATNYTISYSINGAAAINGGSQAGTSYTVNGLNPDDAVTITVTPTGTGCYAAGTGTCTALDCTPPVINVQPIADQTVCEGLATSFDVTVTGASNFQWQISTDNGSNFNNLANVGVYSGVTTNELVLSDVTGLDGNMYQIVITGGDATCQVTLNPAITLTVTSRTNPTFTQIGPLCENDVAPNLASSSTNGFSGTWSPTTIDMNSTTIYTFTPNAGECANSTTMEIEINPSITPTFNQINPLCVNDNAPNLVSTSVNGIDGIWSPATIDVNTSGTTSHTFTPDASFCSSPVTMDITINPNLAPTISCGPSSSNSVTFNWNDLNGVTSYDVTYTINQANITTDNTTNSTFSLSGLIPDDEVEITVTPIGTDCYITSTFTCTAINCDPPIINTQATSNTQCEGNAVTFSVTETGGTAYQWQISSDNGATFNDLNDGGVYAGATTLDLTISDNTGLDATQYQLVIDEATNLCPTTSIPVVLTVNAPVTPSFTAINPICEGEVLAALPLISNNNVNGSWLPALDNTTTTTYTFTPDLNECALENELEIVVNPIPVINAISNTPLCEGDNLVLGVNTVAGSTYSWTGPQGYFSVQQNNVLAGVSVSFSGDYIVTATLNGCNSSSTTTVLINTPAQVLINQVGPFCVTDPSINLSADILGGVWSGNGISNPVTGEFSPSLAAIDTNEITYTITSGCGGSATTSIIVNGQAQAEFTLNNTMLDPINPQVNLINQSQNAMTYEWTFGDNTISDEENPSHTYSLEVRNYTINLIATSIDGCADTASIIVTVPETLIYYVPNSFTPNGDELNNTFLPVFTSGFDPFDYQLSIYNRWGELIFESLDHTIGWDGSFKNMGLVEVSTYVWKITFGIEGNAEKQTVVGTVNILR